jgi:RNA polymerase sigma factor (TIGR02999 family)
MNSLSRSARPGTLPHVGGANRQNPQDSAKPSDADLASTVYAHLRAIAQHQMNCERPGHTLSATALVHEAYLRMVPASDDLRDRAGFYRAAAQAMRHILIDHARRRGAAKRGGTRRRSLDIHGVLDLAQPDQLEDAVALDRAFVRLEKEDQQAADVVRLRFYAGLTGDQAAAVLGVSPRQADRAWAFARAFLSREMRDDD